jgi:hypothetical protein
MKILSKRKKAEGEVLTKDHLTTETTTNNEIFGKIKIIEQGKSRVLTEKN